MIPLLKMLDVLIQTHNEEVNLPFALESVKGWANRVFVVDSGSTDRTVEIAKDAGATVVFHEWAGYATQKNWAIDNLPWESDWILILDADEAVTPELRREISDLLSRQSVHAGYYINRVLIFMGKKIRHCGYFPSWNLRLFRKGKARYEERLVHEHMLVDGPTKHLKSLLLHEDRRGLEHFVAKHNRYSTLEAQEVYLEAEPWPGFKFFTDPRKRRRFLKTRVLPQLPLPWLFKFLYMYIWLEGFIDGKAGWNLCLFIASYEFFIHAKYTELRRLKGRTAPASLKSGLSQSEGALREVDITPAAVIAAEQKKKEEAETDPLSLRERMRVRADKRNDVLSQSNVASSVVPLPEKEEARPSTAEYFHASRASSSFKKFPVSVLIPTLNEEKNMARCLDHLQWADEVVVVDSGSKDKTREISQAYGATVVDFKWNKQWPKKKNWALKNVPFKNDWVLIVDADEWIMPELAEEIAEAIKHPTNVGYFVNRRFIFMGGWIKHCGYYPSWNLRLIKRGCGEYERLTDVENTGSGDNEVHEHVIATGPTDYLKHDMLHFAFPSISVFMEKHNRYSNWEAAVEMQRSRGASATTGTKLSGRRRLKEWSRHLPFRPIARFLYSYIFRGGFLDGKPGLVFCRLLAIYEFLSVAKRYEMERAVDDERNANSLSAVPSSLPKEELRHE